jgi:hypothetical protein
MRRLAAAVALGLLALSACTDRSESPTSPSGSQPKVNASILPSSCPSYADIDRQIDNLFSIARGELVAEAKLNVIVLKLAVGDQAGAQAAMFNLVDFTLQKYNAGLLIGGKSDATQAKVTTLINSLYCIVGLTPPNIPVAALGPNGAAQVVPSTTTATVITQDQVAGIQVNQGSLPQTTIVTITRAVQPLLYQGDQYPILYEFSTSPAVTLTTPQVVGVCIQSDLVPPDPNRLRVAHNVAPFTTGSVEILPLAELPFFLDCTKAKAVGYGPGYEGLGTFARLMRRFGVELASFIAPPPLLAAAVGSGGLGGTTRNFSPFGAVDTLFRMDTVSTRSFIGLAGSAVNSPYLPSVRVTTPTDVPVPGITVTFSVPAGSEGSVGGAVQSTDANGVATVGSWTLGTTPGSDLIVATATPPNLGTGVQGSPISFTATVIPAIQIGYGASNYRYLLIGSNAPPAGFAGPAFGDSGWPLGSAAFGSGPGSPDHCALDASVQTTWAASKFSSTASNPKKTSDLLLRKQFLTPSGWSGTVSVSVAIDNDLQVFVNGTDVTVSAGSSAYVGGFQTHEGCATRGSFVFTASNSILVQGSTNLIAVRARDRGRTSYVDLQVTLIPSP